MTHGFVLLLSNMVCVWLVENPVQAFPGASGPGFGGRNVDLGSPARDFKAFFPCRKSPVRRANVNHRPRAAFCLRMSLPQNRCALLRDMRCRDERKMNRVFGLRSGDGR
jgi:hypothetical protein